MSTASHHPSARPPVRPPVVSGWVVIGAATAWTLVTVASAAVGLLTKGEMQAWVEGWGEDNSGFVLLVALGVLEAITMLVAWVAVSVWLLGLRSAGEAVSPSRPHRRSQLWAVLGWVVPVVSLWFPLQVVEDALRAVGGRSRRLLPVWWATWLVALIGGNLAGHVGGDLVTAGQVTEWVVGLTVAAGLMLLALPAWVLVVRRATTAAQLAADPARHPMA